jgi:hypothetical protein
VTWFTARIVFVGAADGAPKDPLYDDRIYLVEACGAEQALAKAEALGREREDAYLNEHHEWVRWRMHRLLDVYEIDESRLCDGTEVYSRMSADTPVSLGSSDPTPRGSDRLPDPDHG